MKPSHIAVLSFFAYYAAKIGRGALRGWFNLPV